MRISRLYEKAHQERVEELKFVLNIYFENEFIKAHRPWRAVIGNKKCRPIPIHRSIRFPRKEYEGSNMLVWPKMDEETLKMELENLGFVIKDYKNINEELKGLGIKIIADKISISVSPIEKGKELTFAQEWVKKINQSYSEYCAKEKRLAMSIYSEMMVELGKKSTKEIELRKNKELLFYGYKQNYTVSQKCNKYINRFMRENGVRECFEDGEYKGIIASIYTFY